MQLFCLVRMPESICRFSTCEGTRVDTRGVLALRGYRQAVEQCLDRLCALMVPEKESPTPLGPASVNPALIQGIRTL